jgi:hypothetical protein
VGVWGGEGGGGKGGGCSAMVLEVQIVEERYSDVFEPIKSR